jgi:pimeloyl-ACP methyl ester carboxylesterase
MPSSNWSINFDHRNVSSVEFTTLDVAINEAATQPLRGPNMMLAEITIAPNGASRRLRPLLMAAVASLTLSAVAKAGGADDGIVIRSGRAELRSASPIEAGKIPVVFVHGMLGSPASWSVMIDRLSGDKTIHARFQFLTFGYDSLQPIPESGRELLETLAEARRRFDPEGLDDSFDRVVLVGHSLGGLVAKSAANVLGPPTDAPRQPSRPRVGRVIFVARRARGDAAVCTTTSVDQLSWDNPLLRDLEQARCASGVASHSIIAVLREPAEEGATDGVVPLASARLPGARTEVVVRASHVCFQNSEVIQEVRRILEEHAAKPAHPARPESHPVHTEAAPEHGTP